MPDVPTFHDIATPRRMIGGRCRKWCISAQPASGKRASVLSATDVECDSVMMRHVSNSRANRQTNHHYGHANCVNGGLGHDHELFPKQATDQDAVDAVTRQRDTITRTAADAEVLLPFAQDPDQASTAAPPDDEGREEALRMDEEIMDFRWFEHVTWYSIKDLRGTTYVQPPTWFKFALQEAQHASPRAIIHNNPSSYDWNSSGLRTGQHFGPRYAPNVISLQCRMPHAEQPRSKSSHEFAKSLTRAGEKGRALAAARNAPPVPITEQIVQEIKSLYPADPETPAPAQAFVSSLFPVRSG